MVGDVSYIQGLIEAGQIDDAEKKLHELVAIRPTEIDFHLLLTELYIKKQRPDLIRRHMDLVKTLVLGVGLNLRKFPSQLLDFKHEIPSTGIVNEREECVEKKLLDEIETKLQHALARTREEEIRTKFENPLEIEEEEFGSFSSMMQSQDFCNFIMRYLPMIELDNLRHADTHLFGVARGRLVRGAFNDLEKFLTEARAFRSWHAHMINAFTAANDRGAIMEFGVNKGGTIRFIADYYDLMFEEKNIHGFDSFYGIPGEWEGVSFGHLSLNGEAPSVPENVKLHKGWFEDTLPDFVKKNRDNAKFIHMDCDLESSTTTVLNHLQDRVVPGTVIVFDDYFPEQHAALKKFQGLTGLNYRYLSHHYLGSSVAILMQ